MKKIRSAALLLTLLMGMSLLPSPARAEALRPHAEQVMDSASVGSRPLVGYDMSFYRLTLDFYYGGQTYSMHGGNRVVLSNVLAGLGITGEVRKLEVSDPELFTVFPKAGDWIFTALRPFTTDEWLRVITREGTYTIQVRFNQEKDDSSPINGIPRAKDGNIWMAGIKWRVIGKSDENYLLISADSLGERMLWAKALAYCDVVYETFAAPEKAAITPTNKAEGEYFFHSTETDYSIHFGGSVLTDAALFLLSALESETYFEDDPDRIPENGIRWWLRSPNADLASDAGVIIEDGRVYFDQIVCKHHNFRPRPAFQLNRSAILLESAADGRKSAAVSDGAFGPVIVADERKLTLIDSGRSTFSASVDRNAVSPGESVTISYRGVPQGEHVSAILADEEGTALYYASKAPDGTGTWALTMPADLILDATYTLKLFSEQRNGAAETDYASVPLCLPLRIQEPGFVVTAADPAEGGSITGAGAYAPGSEATLTAAANEGYTFVNWTKNGVVVGTDAAIRFPVTGVTNLVAHFSLRLFAVTVTADPAEGGRIAGACVCSRGTIATLTASPNPGYAFVGWVRDGATVSADLTYRFPVMEDAQIKAVFQKIASDEK